MGTAQNASAAAAPRERAPGLIAFGTKTTHFGHSAKRKCCSYSTRESTKNTSSKNILTLGTAQNASAAAAPRERAPGLLLVLKTTHFGHSAKRKCCSCSTREITKNTSSKNILTLGTAQNASAAAAPREKALRTPQVKINSLWAQRKTQVLQLLHVRKHRGCLGYKKQLTLGTAQNASAAAALREKALRTPQVKINSLWAQRKTQMLQLFHVREHQDCLGYKKQLTLGTAQNASAAAIPRERAPGLIAFGTKKTHFGHSAKRKCCSCST